MYFKQLFTALTLVCFTTESFSEDIEHTEIIGVEQQRQSINDIDLKQYNGFENIVTRTEFEDRFTQLNDIINELPSVQTRNAGGIGSYSSASIRGSSSKQVNIFVDGILLSSPQTGFGNLSVIPTSVIEAVEVYPDFTPIQLSDGNLAGAINIRTRKISDGDNGGKLSATYGSFNTKGAEISTWFNAGKTDYLIAASSVDSDNDFPVDSGSFEGVSAGDSNKRQNAAFDQRDLFIKFRSQLNEQFVLQSVLNHSNSDNELPTRVNKKIDNATLEQKSNRADFTLESTVDNRLWGARLFAFKNNDIFSDPDERTSVTQQIIDQQHKGLGSTGHYEIKLANHQVSGSVSLSKSEINNINKLQTTERVESSRRKITAAIADTWHVKQDLSLQAIYRAYNVADESKKYTNRVSDLCNNGTKECGDSNHHKTSWQIGLAHQINKDWEFKINTGQFVRIPTLSEKFGNFGNYISEPELKPEESNNTDIGILFHNKQLLLQATGFYKEINNGIFIEYDTSGTGHPANIGKSWIAGLEGMLSWQLFDEWTVDFSGHAMDSENQSANNASHGKKVFGIYHFSFLSALTWHNSLQSVSLSYQVDDELSYIESGLDKADKKSVINSSYTIFLDNWTLNLSINNLLDERYSDYSRMPAPGRSYFTTINYEFH